MADDVDFADARIEKELASPLRASAKRPSRSVGPIWTTSHLSRFTATCSTPAGVWCCPRTLKRSRTL